MEYTYNILNEVYYWMLSKEKNVEVRILKDKSSKISIGDYITFTNLDNEKEYIKVKVTNKKQFDNIDALLKEYKVDRIMPHHTNKDLKELINNIYGEQLINGKLVAFEFEYISSDK